MPPRGDRTDLAPRSKRKLSRGMTPEGPANCEVPLAVRGLPSHDRSRGNNRPSFTRPGQVAVVSPILVQAAFDCALSSTVRGTPHTAGQGLLPGRRPFHHIPMEPPVHHLHRHHRAVSLLLRSSDSRPSGSHPTPCSPKWGLSSAAGRCRRGPPSAALCLLASGRGRCGGNSLPSGGKAEKLPCASPLRMTSSSVGRAADGGPTGARAHARPLPPAPIGVKSAFPVPKGPVRRFSPVGR